MKFSVGVPVYNEEANIERLLKNLLNQPLGPQFKRGEIWVVASGCTDRTADIVRGHAEKHTCIRLIEEEERRGKSYALSIILKRISEDVLVIVGGDNFPGRNSLHRLLLPFREENVGAVTGRPLPVNDPDSFWGYVSHLIWGLHHELCSRDGVKLSSEFCAVRSDLVKEIPHNIVNDDAYMEWIIREQGYKIIYAPDAISYMKGPGNLRDFVNQRRRVAHGHLQIYDEVTRRRFVPPTYDFLKVTPAMLRMVGPSLRSLCWSFVASFLEACCHLLARFDRLRGRSTLVWERVPSTKWEAK